MQLFCRTELAVFERLVYPDPPGTTSNPLNLCSRSELMGTFHAKCDTGAAYLAFTNPNWHKCAPISIRENLVQASDPREVTILGIVARELPKIGQ